MNPIPGPGHTTSHPDFHLPDCIDVGTNFDVDNYIATLKRGNVDVVYFFAKCHYGNSYYETKVGKKHPGLKRDMLREITDACRKADITIIVYFSGGIDTHAAKMHPEWRAQPKKDQPPEPVASDLNTLLYVCLFSPYVEDWLIPQIREVAENYDFDGMMTDTMSSFICYCPSCTSAYKSAFGRKLPDSPEDEDWKNFCNWRYERKEQLIDKICRAAHEIKPDLPVSLNWVYSLRDPVPPNPGLHYLLGDEVQHLPTMSATSRYYAGTGKPFELMTMRFIHGLGDWSTKPIDMMKQAMALVSANCGRCTLIDRQLPDGKLEESYYERLGEVFKFIHERKSVFENAEHVKQTALLHSATTLFGPEKEFYGKHHPKMLSVVSASWALSESSRHFTMIGEAALEKSIDQYETVVLPEQSHLPDSLIKKIREYVKNGGKIIATHKTGFYKHKWLMSDIFGLEYDGDYPYTHVYTVLDTKEQHEFAGTQVMISGSCARLTCKGAKVLAGMYEPLLNERFGWGKAPPGNEPSTPAVTINRFGKGLAVYVAGPLFESLRANYNPAAVWMFDQILRITEPAPLLDVRSDDALEVVCTKQSGAINIHLINKNGEREFEKKAVVTRVPPSGPVSIQLRLEKNPEFVHEKPAERLVDFTFKDGVLECALNSVHIHTCIQIEL